MCQQLGKTETNGKPSYRVSELARSCGDTLYFETMLCCLTGQINAPRFRAPFRAERLT